MSLTVASREATQSASRAAKLDPQRCFSIRAIDGFRPFSELLSERSETVPDREAGMLSTYTSGTTGRPKGIRRALTGADPDVRAGAYNMLSMFGIEPGGEHVHLAGSPLYHSAPFGFLMFSLHFGHAIVLHDKWDPERVLADVERYRITHTQMVPTQFHRLLALPDDVKAQYDLSSLRVVAHAGAPCPVDVKANMIKWLGPIVYEYYGASEGVGGTFVSPKEALEHPGTVGRLLDPAAEIKILDDDGNEVAPGEVGTIYTTLVGGGENSSTSTIQRRARKPDAGIYLRSGTWVTWIATDTCSSSRAEPISSSQVGLTSIQRRLKRC